MRPSVANAQPSASSRSDLRAELRFLKGVGPRRAAELERAGLRTSDDLLHRFPLRYEDRSRVVPSSELRRGEAAAVRGQVVSSGLRRTRRRGFSLFEMLLRDDAGTFRAVWMNRPYLKTAFSPGQTVLLYGAPEWRDPGGLHLSNPEYEVLGDGDEGGPADVPPADERPDDPPGGAEDGREAGRGLHSARVVPVYERIGTLTTKQLRGLVHRVLERLPADLDDPLPADLRARRRLPDRRRALREAHFPSPGTSPALLNRFRSPAQVRLILEELFLFRLGLEVRGRSRTRERKPHAVRVDDRIRRSALAVLPFRLTPGQRRALRTIVDDLRRPWPMNRLLQGDVGCGKTIVAVLAALVALENGLQVAFMAPTELLAEQHFLTLRPLLARSRFRVVSLTGSQGAKARRDTLTALEKGEAHLAVGTHALVQSSVAFRRLGLAIIDEQHRFGVRQRATLREKGRRPDILVMTATPIPRSLALTAYGDLDVSVIRDRPPGRAPVDTRIEPESRREAVHALVEGQLRLGRQAYVVYPLVDESDKLDLKAATVMVDTLARRFPGHGVDLLHGRMKSEERETVMARFAAGDAGVLVATTVIEVGVDVPGASVMVVENAERFGLAQLHQLRGRVGRGPGRAWCRLLYQEPLSEAARARLEAVAGTTDGFELAEHDLRLRGPGEVLGTRQSGLPTLRLANLVRDQDIMDVARDEAARAMREGVAGDVLGRLDAGWRERFGLAGVG